MSVSPSGADIPELRVGSRRSDRAFPAPADLRVEPSAWSTFVTTQVDALIIGDAVAVSRVLTFMWPTLQKPVFWCDSRRLSFPGSSEGTVILKDIHEFDTVDQQRMLDWLSSGTRSPRLVATASGQLLPLLDNGLFLRSLYKRVKGVELVVERPRGTPRVSG
jgi:Sigma-54 interaction domain